MNYLCNKRIKLYHREIKMDSLENLCLNLVVEKFSLFHSAFSKSADLNLQHNFEFLQRAYSLKLATELHKRSLFKDEYFDFIFNEYVEFLDGKWLSDPYSSYYQVSRNCRIPIAKVFSRLPNLKTMVCLKTCDDKILENVAKFCHKIVKIDIRNSDVTNKGIKYLCKVENGKVPCPKIKHLLIENTQVTNEGLTCLIKNLPVLETIDSANVFEIIYSLYKDGFIRDYNFVDIDMLKLDKIELNADLFKVCFTVCPRLKSFACCIFTEGQLDAITNDLNRLHLKFVKKGRNINVNPFLESKGSKLSSLSIYNVTMSISILAKCCPKLKKLCISHVTFLDDDVNSSSNFNCLVECNFKHFNDDESPLNKAISSLLSSENLQSISFSFCFMSSTMKYLILNCCKNNKIKIVSFECIIVEGQFMMEILRNCSTLTHLNINVCDLLGYKRPLYELAERLPNKPIITPLHRVHTRLT